MKMQQAIEAGSGVLLIAEPFLKDPNFSRTVVLICNHSDEGSFGLVLTQAFDFDISDLIEELAAFPIPVGIGGPVQQNSIHFIHRVPELVSEGQQVAPDIYWGGNFDEVKTGIISGQITAADIRFFIGYSGWSSGQLVDELTEKSWLMTSAKADVVFSAHPENIWRLALEDLGEPYSQMINYPIDPQLN